MSIRSVNTANGGPVDESLHVVFTAEARALLDQMDVIHDLVESRVTEKGPAGIESLGFQLHNLYCAYEDVLVLVARVFENNVDSSAGYHIELLRRMTITVPGVRPHVISGETFRLLGSLRGFRHVFRHAYGLTLDRRKIDIVVDDARDLRVRFRNEVEDFFSNLETG